MKMKRICAICLSGMLVVTSLSGVHASDLSDREASVMANRQENTLSLESGGNEAGSGDGTETGQVEVAETGLLLETDPFFDSQGTEEMTELPETELLEGTEEMTELPETELLEGTEEMTELPETELLEGAEEMTELPETELLEGTEEMTELPETEFPMESEQDVPGMFSLSGELKTSQAPVPKEVSVTSGSTAADIQNLLDQNAAGAYILTVNIPAGTYYLNRTLYVYPNTAIKAASGAKLVKKSGYGATIEAKLTDDKGGYNGNHDISITGGIWDSEPIKNQKGGTETFRFIHCSNITITGAVFSNVPEGSHHIVFAGVQNANVSGCKFFGYGDDGDGVVTPKEALQLDVAYNNVLVPTAQNVKWDDLPCNKITVSNCEFYDFSRGIGSHTAVAGKLHSNVVIKNNKFHDLSDSAIRLYNYKDTSVTGNTIDNAVEGILAYTTIEEAEKDSFFLPLHGAQDPLPANYNITIAGNIVKNIKSSGDNWGDAIRVIGSKERPIQGVNISGNTISAVSRYGVFATYAPKMSVTGSNKINGSKKDGILAEQSAGVVISQNSIEKAGKTGIALYYSNDASIYGNTVTAPAQDGIYLIQSEKCMIGTGKNAGNTVNKPGKNGIYLTTEGKTGCTSSTVQYNNIVSAKENGVGVYRSSKVTVKNNTVTATGNGIYFNTNSTYPSVTSNMVKSAGKNGIWISSGSKYANVENNTVSKYSAVNKDAFYGIYLYQSGGSKSKNAQILRNKVTGTGSSTKKDGIRISNSSYSKAAGNTVTNPAGCGIYVIKSTNCTLGDSSKSYNTIKSPKNHGIYLTTSCTGAKVLYNRITSAAKDGIGVYKSKSISVKGNSISAKGNGIYVNTGSAKCNISSNKISSAGKHGIWVSSKSQSSSINSNTISKYATSGTYSAIYLYQSGGTGKNSRSYIKKNKITGSGKSKKKDAIKLSNSAYTTVEANTVKSAPGTGIYIYKSKYCNVNKNTVTSAKSRGIYATTKCNGAKITSNTVSKAGDVSIAIYDSASSSLTSNKVITKSSLKGIWVSKSSKTQIKSNTVKGAKKANAIVVTSSSKVIKSKNKISGK